MLNLYLLECAIKNNDHISDLLLIKYWVIICCKYSCSISDPANGKYTLDKKAFLKCWTSTKRNDEDTGVALLLAPTPEFYEQQTNKETKDPRGISYYFRYLLPYKPQLFQLVVGLLLGSVLSLIFPFLAQAMVDQGIGNANLSLITLIL